MPVKVIWCKFCHQTPPGGDLKPLPQLEAILPDYEHVVCSFDPIESGGFTATFKLRLSAEQEVQKWLEDFQTSSKTTWRILKTYPTIERSRRNKYRVDLRCQRKIHKSGASSKKNTSCPALLYLVLKKESIHQSRRTRPLDPHVQHQLAFHISLRSNHNHELSGPESLQYRDVSKETIQKLEKLFQKGHSPTTALKALKNELRAQMGDAFEAAAADRALCPDIMFCFRLFYKICPHKKKIRKSIGKEKFTGKAKPNGKAKSTANAIFNPQLETDSPDESFEPLRSGMGLQEVSISPAPAQDCSFFTVVDFSSIQTPSLSQSSDTEIRLRGMFECLLQKLKTDQTFEEPVKDMLCSFETMGTDMELISALKTFGRMRKGNSGRSAKRPRIEKNA